MGFYRQLQLFMLIITLITNTFWIAKLIAINPGYSGIHEFFQISYLVVHSVLAGNIKCWGCGHMHHQEGHWFWCICGGKFSLLYKFLWSCISAQVWTLSLADLEISSPRLSCHVGTSKPGFWYQVVSVHAVILIFIGSDVYGSLSNYYFRLTHFPRTCN